MYPPFSQQPLKGFHCNFLRYKSSTTGWFQDKKKKRSSYSFFTCQIFYMWLFTAYQTCVILETRVVCNRVSNTFFFSVNYPLFVFKIQLRNSKRYSKFVIVFTHYFESVSNCSISTVRNNMVPLTAFCCYISVPVPTYFWKKKGKWIFTLFVSMLHSTWDKFRSHRCSLFCTLTL